jgi:cholesterol oxidase
MKKSEEIIYDYVIVGSGFGGSVSALRLAEKGYRVLVLEKGKHFSPKDFPETNWQLKKWLWLPALRFFGFFKITFFRHAGILSGVGVGGGSLVYANTLPRPKSTFFKSGNWEGLADWENELEPHYQMAEKMLGAATNPTFFDADKTLNQLAVNLGRPDKIQATRVSVFFGEPDVVVKDPFFDGKGPDRSGCNFCGGCMTGCRYDAKNSLDKNYLYLAKNLGVEIRAERKVTSVKPLNGKANGEDGYAITHSSSTAFLRKGKEQIKTRGVVFSGGVLGTVRLLLDMKKRDHLPDLSDKVGNFVRTNNESLILVASRNPEKDFSKGVAIGSILEVDEDSHLEVVRYRSGSGFWKTLGAPMTYGSNMLTRSLKLVLHLLTKPVSWLRVYFMRDFARSSVVLLFMQHLDSSLRLKRGLFNMKSSVSEGKAPSAFMELSKKLAEEVSSLVKGKPFVLATEVMTGTPTTAHILGGAVIGKDAGSGVIDKNHNVFGYRNMHVCDGSAVSANPGVNPSLTITAMSERAMSKIPLKGKVIKD